MFVLILITFILLYILQLSFAYYIARSMVNPLGILNLSKTYDHVVFTDSYKDWSKEMEIPANCTMAPL